MAAAVTGMFMGFGFWLEQRHPRTHVPILFVGFLWGILIGGLMWLAFRVSSDRPEHRVAVSAITVVIGAGYVFGAVSSAVGPSLHLGADLGSGRIERPEAGFAVTFPDVWVVSEATPETDEFMFGDLEQQQQANQTTVVLAELPSLLSRDKVCMVVDFTPLAELPPRWKSVDDATAAFWAGISEASDSEGVRSSYHVLDAGRTGHVSGDYADGGTFDMYFFTDLEAWFYLECQSAEPPPADRWLSIAESFEFLPEQQLAPP